MVSGTEAGGHCGSVSTMVLVPEVHRAIQPYGDVPILAAGGIVTSWSGKSAHLGGQVLAAANQKLHQQALHILNPYCDD